MTKEQKAKHIREHGYEVWESKNGRNEYSVVLADRNYNVLHQEKSYNAMHKHLFGY